MRKYLYIFIVIYIFSFIKVNAETVGTAGFIPGQIWYSSESLTEGDTVKIYTAVWNRDSKSLSAHVDFYDKNVVLGSRDIVVLAGELKDVSISWKITSGEHSISAKITSSILIDKSNKKETVLLKNNLTEEDNQFVPVVVSKVDGTSATSSDVLKSQIGKVGSQINNILPSSVVVPVSNGAKTLDTFRQNTSVKIDTSKEDVKKQIDSLNKIPKKEIKDSDAKDSIEKPIAQVKLFFLSVLSFIFNTKIVFYGLIILLSFFIIRYFYRKIRNI